MMLNLLVAVLGILGAVDAAAVAFQTDEIGSHDQKPLAVQSTSTVYNVERFHLSSREELEEALRQAEVHNLDVWSTTSEYIDIHFNSSERTPYFLKREYTSFSPSYVPEVQAATSLPGKYPTIGSWDVSTVSNCTFHNNYWSYTDIISFAQQLAEEYPKLVEVIKLGRSAEGRDVIGLSIGKRSGKGGKRRKRRMVIQGTQHAREWISPAAALYFAHALLVRKSDPRSKHKLLKHMDFTVIPLPNPDGYAYTWEYDRLWYKNRQNVRGGKCKGLDLNRNWDYEWRPSTDSDPCSHWYPGHQPFEALESRAIAAYIKRTPNIRAFLDLRSYGQIIMHPFSHSCQAHAPDEENLMEAALGAAQALYKTHGTVMKTGSLCDKLYSAPGNIVDWMYGKAGITVAYSVMLRDTGTYGFLLPAHWVRPVGEEVSDMVAYLSRWIKKRKP